MPKPSGGLPNARLEALSGARLLAFWLIAILLAIPFSCPAGGGYPVVWGVIGQAPAVVTNPPPGATNLVALSAGNNFTVGVRDDGTVVAWGVSSAGQTNVPPTASNVVAVSAGYYHTLAARADGSVVGWGSSSSGVTNVPAAATNPPAVRVATGYDYGMTLRSNGTLFAWTTGYPTRTNLPPRCHRCAAHRGLPLLVAVLFQSCPAA